MPYHLKYKDVDVTCDTPAELDALIGGIPEALQPPMYIYSPQSPKLTFNSPPYKVTCTDNPDNWKIIKWDMHIDKPGATPTVNQEGTNGNA